MASTGIDTGAPTFLEHVTIARMGHDSLYAEFPKEYAELIAKQQSLESLEGVLAVHVVPESESRSGRSYLQHFRAVDMAALNRVVQESHRNHARLVLLVSKESRDKYGHMTECLEESNTTTVQENHPKLLKQLSTHRLHQDCNVLLHADWEGHPAGSHAAKFPAYRICCRKAKEGTPASLLDKYMKEVRELPTHFPLLKQVTIGRNLAESLLDLHHYPEAATIDWDVVYFFGYASDHDKDKLDSTSEFVAFDQKWTELLGDNCVSSDLNVDHSGR